MRARVPNGEGAFNVFWAPDGRSIFLTVGGSVRRYGLDGDSYQVICNTPAIMLSGVVIGSHLLISARTANFSVPAAGGTPKAVGELYPWPQMLPDRKHLLYTAFDAEAGHHRARVVTTCDCGLLSVWRSDNATRADQCPRGRTGAARIERGAPGFTHRQDPAAATNHPRVRRDRRRRRPKLRQHFRNEYRQPLELVYTFPLPADSAVSGYEIRAGERLMKGRIERRDDARAYYETARLDGRTAGLVDQERSNVFTQRLGNIPPLTDVTVELTIDQPLQWIAGTGGSGDFRLSSRLDMLEPRALFPTQSP